MTVKLEDETEIETSISGLETTSLMESETKCVRAGCVTVCMFRCVDRLIQCDEDLTQLVSFLREHDHSDLLRHYTGHNVDHILHLLTFDQPRPSVTSSSLGNSRKSRDSEIRPVAYDVTTATEIPSRKPRLDAFRRAARGLHYASIGILSFLLLEVKFKIIIIIITRLVLSHCE